jgi:hypothetical protein
MPARGYGRGIEESCVARPGYVAKLRPLAPEPGP